MAEDQKGQRWPSNAELANAEALKVDDKERVGALQGGPGEVIEVNAPYAVEDNDTSNYVGVSPEYMTYANDTEKPLRAEEGLEKELEDQFLDGDRFKVAQAVSAEDNATQGGGSVHQTVYPAVSGEAFTSTKAKESPDKAKAPNQSSDDEPRAAKKAAPARPSVAGQGDTGQ